MPENFTKQVADLKIEFLQKNDMNIEDIEIKIKKYDREKQVVIVYILLFGQLEIRGFRARFGRTKYSPNASVWIVSPPAVKTKNKYFWIVEFKDSNLWKELEKRIIKDVRSYTNLHI